MIFFQAAKEGSSCLMTEERMCTLALGRRVLGVDAGFKLA